MSKLPKNFEKALLGVAGVCAIGFIALGFMKSSAVETEFAHNTANSGKDDSTIPQAEATARAVASLTTNLTIDQADDNERKVDTFTGIALFADKNNPNQPIDFKRGRVVHDPIPNIWWLDTGADPTYADSPARDDDSDGFSNLEEWKAQTLPVDPKSVPSLINKLAYVKDESTQWYVEFGLESEGQWAPRLIGRSPDKKGFANRVSAASMLKAGDTFFVDKQPFQARFRFIGIAPKEVTSKRTNLTQNVNVAQFEDLKPNKKGIKYESQYGLPDNEIDANSYYDRTAVLDLQAVGEKGKEFRVEEGTTFALPPGAAEKKYLMKAVTLESIEVEYTDEKGEKQTKSIPKGGTAAE
ncbi:Amuc_1099 family pilus-like system protein [Luteolibacter sp. Populi]|uniref:Amuc_1099 family pilus-like system protein n=1 Tax=Luteolibacter sp. Populi TaxID=3230487 RepID=UPI00346697E9